MTNRVVAVLAAFTLACGGDGGGGPGPVEPGLEVHALTVGGSGAGSARVISSPDGIACDLEAGSGSGACSADFKEGTSVTLTVDADPGSTFDAWSGPCSGSGTCVVAMSEPRQVSARLLGPPVAIRIEPRLTVLDILGTSALTVTARDADGVSLPWTSLDVVAREPGVARVTSSEVQAERPGATRIVAGANTVFDSVVVAGVPGGGFALVASTGSDSADFAAPPGSTVMIDLFLLSAPNGIGDLGSLQGTLIWDPSRLVYQSSHGTQSEWTWLTNPEDAAAGRLRFGAFSARGTAGSFALARLTFTVPSAASGHTSLRIDSVAAGNAAGADISNQIQPVLSTFTVR